MIKYIEGDLFKSPAQVIVNTVNTVGVMGKGIALSYKNRYPEMFKKYQKVCDNKQLQIGKLMLWYGPDYWVLLFPTKKHWRNPSKLEYLELGLEKFINTYAEKQITSIAFPQLGCGNGELDWQDVRPLMEKYLKPLPIDVYVYTQSTLATPVPEHKKQRDTIEWLRANAKDMSFLGVKDDIINNSKKDLFLLYQFSYKGDNWEVEWEDQCNFRNLNSGEKIGIIEASFQKYWDKIRDLAIFPKETSDIEFDIACALLNSLGYLSEVKIQESMDHEMVEGYQLNEGAGRAFALQGNCSDL